MTGRIRKFLTDDSGPTSVEYAVMLAMIVGVCIASITLFANVVGASFDDSAGRLSGVLGS